MFTRMAELYAGYMEHTDEQIGRLVDALERTGQLENTLLFVFVGDNGSSEEGGLDGLFNEQSITVGGETIDQNIGRIDAFGLPGSYNHYPVGWAIAGNTPFQLCKQYAHFGGVRNPLVVHWPAGIAAKGELSQQESVEGYSMNYSFASADATSPRRTQYSRYSATAVSSTTSGRWSPTTAASHGRAQPRGRSRRTTGSSTT